MLHQVKLVDAGHLEDGGFHQDVQRGVACVPEGVGIEFFRIDEGFPLSRQNGFLFADLGVGKKGVEAGAGAPGDHLDGSQPVDGHSLSPGHVRAIWAWSMAALAFRPLKLKKYCTP